MTYLTHVWEVIWHNPGAVTVAIGGMLLYSCFLRPRFKWWLYPMMLALSFIALPMIYELLTAVLDEPQSYSILMTCLGYWVAIMVLIAFKERFGAIITLILTQGILNRLFTFGGYILHIPLNAAVGGNLQVGVSVSLVLVVMYSLILLVCWLVLREKGRKLIQTQLRRQNWVVLASFSLSAKLIIDFCSDYAFALNPYSDIKIIWAMIALCLFSVAVLALYLYSTISTLKYTQQKATSDRLIFEKEAQQRYYEVQLHNQEEIRRMKHDMNGHITTVTQLLEEDNKDEATCYLKNLVSYAQSHQKKLYSNDPYLNAVVTNYAALFTENETAFEHDIQSGRIELHHVEMCLALNNALQNALEASLKLPTEQRYVRLQVKTKQNHFLFRVTNHFDNKLIMDNGLPRSTKEGEGHGYGLTSIRDAVESVGGFVVCKIEGDIFVLDVDV